jgi:hypothetical protein
MKLFGQRSSLEGDGNGLTVTVEVIKKEEGGSGGIHEVLERQEETLERQERQERQEEILERVNLATCWIRQETEFWPMKEWKTTERGRRQETGVQKAQGAREAAHPRQEKESGTPSLGLRPSYR